MSQRKKNRDVFLSEFYHYSQQNYHKLIALFLRAKFVVLHLLHRVKIHCTLIAIYISSSTHRHAI